MYSRAFLLCLLAHLSTLATSTPCLGPSVTPRVYTSTEAPLATATVFIVEFALTCKNEVETPINLYATVNGRTIPAVKTKDGDYQVSIVEEHSAVPKGVYDVGIYDEDGYASLRKAQRSEGAATVEPLAVIPVNHGGVWKGAPVQSELVALLVAVFVWYLAHSAKSNLQDSS